jgi:translation initiation factor 2D
MFKKPFKLQTPSLLKKSEQRKFRENVKKAFNLTDDALAQLVAVKDEVSVARVAETHILIYTVNGQPLFFEPTGRGDLFPTVYSLWKAPSLLPAIATHGPVFVRYISRGADLMLPGVVLPQAGPSSLGEFLIGQKRAIVIGPASTPVAVGTMALSAKQLAQQGLHGKALKVLHFYRDHLWALGTKENPPLTLPSDAEAAAEEAADGEESPENEELAEGGEA